MRNRLMAAVAVMAMPTGAMALDRPAPPPTGAVAAHPQSAPSCEANSTLASGAKLYVRYGQGKAPTGSPVGRVSGVLDSEDALRADLTYDLSDLGGGLAVSIEHVAQQSGRAWSWLPEPKILVMMGNPLSRFRLSAGGESVVVGAYTPLSNRMIAAALLSGEPIQAALETDAGNGPRGTIRLDGAAYRTDFAAAQTQAEAAYDRYLDQTCTKLVNCYLTAAAVTAVGLADDCWELRTLRRFRDTVMAASEPGRAMIRAYYATAPGLVARIERRADARRVWLKTYVTGILPCAILARLGLNAWALKGYRAMTARLEAAAST